MRYNSPATIYWNGEFFLAARLAIADCFPIERLNMNIFDIFFDQGFIAREWQLDTEMTIYDIPLKVNS